MSDPAEPKPYSSSNKTMHFWAIGAIDDYMMYAMFALISNFFVASFGMDPVWVNWALFLPRIFDGFADPILGHWSDNTHTRWGRRRPFLLVSSILGAVLIIAVWWMSPNWGQWAQFSWVLVMSLLLFLCWGAYTMNHLALGYELSDDYHIRTKVLAVRGFYFACAATAGSYFYWFATLRELPRGMLGLQFGDVYRWIVNLHVFPQQGLSDLYQKLVHYQVFPNDIVGMRTESVAIAIVGLAAAIFTVYVSRERFQRANRQHVNIIQAIKATMTVKPFVVLLSLRIIGTLGGTLLGSVMFYIGAYSVCLGDKHLYLSLPIYNGWIGLFMAGTLVFVAVRMSKFIGKRRGLILSYGIAFLAACCLPFFASPGHPYLLLTHMILFGPIFATLLGVFQAAVMPDICDIDELQSGERREGLFSAVGSFINKMENSICVVAGGYILSYSGFDAKHAAANIAQAPEALVHLRWLAFTPAIIFSGIVFCLSWLYPVTERYMANVRAQLDERRRSGRAQEGPESEVMAK